jgi:hypothetical protein
MCFSPTHKRAKGRAPVWGSEFTSKAAALQGGSSRNRCWAQQELWTSVRGDLRAHAFSPSLFLDIFKNQHRI